MSGQEGEFGYHELERCALAFVLEDESWPVFLAWARHHHVSAAAHDWLESGPELAEYRAQFLEHSPEPHWRAVARQGPPVV